MSKIITYLGYYFDFENPRSRDIDIEDIAHSLSKICRFNGHIRCEHYSVAQHSVLVSYLTKPENAMAGLMHDAPEAYTGDTVSPFKRLLSNYKEYEDRIFQTIIKKFKFKAEEMGDVKRADEIALCVEMRDLTAHVPENLYLDIPHIVPMTAAQGKLAFLGRFYQLQRCLKNSSQNMLIQKSGALNSLRRSYAKGLPLRKGKV